MRRLALVCGTVLLSIGSAATGAQQAGTQFKSGVTLVPVDVTVLDKDGQPVPGLTAKDFEVKLNGRVQPVRSLTFLQAQAVNEMGGAVGPTFDAVTPATAVAPAAAVPGAAPVTTTPRLFVILVDDLSFPPTRGRGLFAAARRFLTTLADSDRAGLATTTGTKAINPTADRAPLEAALTSMVGAYADPRSTTLNGPRAGRYNGPDQSIGISQALAADRGESSALEEAVVRECFGGDRSAILGKSLAQLLTEDQCASTVQTEARRVAAAIKATTEQQLRTFASVIRAMQPATGIKHLVVLTDGIAWSQDVEALVPVARAAAEAGVQVSVIVEQLDMSLADQGRRESGGQQQVDTGASQRRREDDAMLLNGARTVADNIGAVFHNVIGVPDPFFARVRAAASAVYRLAVEPPSDAGTGRDFAVNARVNRPGLTVIANRRAVAGAPAGATAPAPPAPRFESETKRPLSVDEQLQRAAATGRGPGGLRMSLASAVRRADDPAMISVDVTVDIPGTAPGPLETMLAVVDARGAIRSSRRQLPAPAAGSDHHVEFSLPLAPGAYKLRFAAADPSGAIGVVEAPVEARLTTMGTVAASELLRWTINAAGERRGVAGDAIPGDAKTLLLALELYPSGEPPADLLVRFSVTVPGAEAAATERIVGPEPRDGRLVAEVEYLLDRLGAGTYNIRATVMSGPTALGTVSAIARR